MKTTALAPDGTPSALAEKVERAAKAVQAAQRMLPQWRAFARTVSRKPNLQVHLTGGVPCTDGDNIWLGVPLELADLGQHVRSDCGKRDENYQLICPACNVEELAASDVYHELAHILFGTFEPVSDAERTLVYQRALDEQTAGKANTRRAKAIRQALDSLPENINYGGISQIISPFLPTLINALEDTRIEARMMTERPGTIKMFQSSMVKIMALGMEKGDGSRTEWRLQERNLQAMIAVFCEASRFDARPYLIDDVQPLLDDPRMRVLVDRIQTARSALDIYQIAFPVLEVMRDHGFCLSPDDLPDDEELPEEQPEPDNQSEEDDEDGTDGAGDPDGGEAGEDDQPVDQDGEEDGTAEPAPDDDAGHGGSDDGDVPSDDDQDTGEQPEDPSDDAAPGGEGAGESGDDPQDGDDVAGSGDEAPSDDAEGAGEGDGDGAQGDGGVDDEPGEGASPQSDAADEGSDSGDAGSAADDPPRSEGADGEGSGEASGPAGGDSSHSGDELGDDNSSPEGSGDHQDGTADQDGDDPGGDDSPGEGGSGQDQADDAADGSDADADDGDQGGDQPSDRDAEEAIEGADADSPSGSSGLNADGGDQQQPTASDVGDVSPSDDHSPTNSPDGSQTGQDHGMAGEQSQPSGDPGMPGDGTPSNSSAPGGAVQSGQPDPGLPSATEAGDDPAAPYTEEDMARDGSPEKVDEAFKVFGGHGDEPAPEDRPYDEQELRQLINLVISQLGLFDQLSVNVSGVDVIRQGDKRGGWEYDEQFPAITIPETILQPALARLRVAFTNNQRSQMERHLTSGKIDTGMLGKRITTGDPRLFRRKRVPGKRDYAVLLGGDTSGSTGYGVRLRLIKETMYAQAELLNRLGIPFLAATHTGIELDGGHGVAINMVKEFHEPWDAKAKDALSQVHSSDANLDGHTLEFYRKRIQREQATDKLIIYYTDGAMPAANFKEELAILQREIAICQRLGIHLVGIGVNTDSPRQHGLDTILINSLEDVPMVVDELRKRLA